LSNKYLAATTPQEKQKITRINLEVILLFDINRTDVNIKQNYHLLFGTKRYPLSASLCLLSEYGEGLFHPFYINYQLIVH
jgi:hypothetical protein